MHDITTLLNKTGALLEGHFQLTSGLHSDKYVQCAQLLQHPEYAGQLGKELADKFEDLKNKKICVVGLALGGITVGYELARALKARSIFAERKDGKMQIRRNFTIEKDEYVIVAEDVVTTGGSVREVIDLLRGMKVNLVGVAGLIHRSKKETVFDCRFEYLVRVTAATYEPDVCPLCQQKLPIDKPGSRNFQSGDFQSGEK